MKDTRNFDRAPLKDIRVKDNQVGIRTPQVLIKREGGEYMKGDILDANATTELAKSIHIPDIEKINEELAKTVKTEQIGKPNGVASLDQNGSVPTEQLGNIDTNLFVIVDQLPDEDIKDGKIYCIKDTSSTDKQNVYIEYAYLNGKWEKIGEFKAEPDLSNYAQLNDDVTFRDIEANGGYFYKDVSINTIHTRNIVDGNKVFGAKGNLFDIGSEESFVFTLEDGTKVTKTIRVTATSIQAEA